MGKPTMMFEATEHVLIAVHGNEPPSDDEWESYIKSSASLPASCRKILVVTAGAGPNAKQRATINEQPWTMTVAICTDAMIVKQIVTALSWFNPKVKAFGANDIGAALRYLDVSGREAALIHQKIAKMRLEISKPANRVDR